MDTGLVDPWLHFHPHHKDFATHERGSQRIDAALVSHSLIPAIESVSYSPVGLFHNNDHRTIFLQLSKRKLFGMTTSNITRLQDRSVRANDKASVTTYVETMYNYLESHSVFVRSKALQHNTSDGGTLVETLDQIIGQASDYAESKCRKRRPEWFSVPLTKQRLTVSYLKHLQRGYQQGINRVEVVSTKLRMIDAAITNLPTEEDELTRLIHDENKRLKEMRHNSRQLRIDSMADSDSKPGQRIRKHEIAETRGERIRN